MNAVQAGDRKYGGLGTSQLFSDSIFSVPLKRPIRMTLKGGQLFHGAELSSAA